MFLFYFFYFIINDAALKNPLRLFLSIVMSKSQLTSTADINSDVDNVDFLEAV